MSKKLSVYIGLGSMVRLSDLSEKLIKEGYNFTITRGIGVWKDQESGELFNEEQITFTFLLFDDKSEHILSLITEYLQENTLELCLAYDQAECEAGFRDTQLILETTPKLDGVRPVRNPQVNPGLLKKAAPYNPENRFRCLEPPKELSGKDLVGCEVFLPMGCECGARNYRGLGIIRAYENVGCGLDYQIVQEDIDSVLSWHKRECFILTD